MSLSAPTFSLRGLLLTVAALALAFAYFRPCATPPEMIAFQPGASATSSLPDLVSDESFTNALLADDRPTASESVVCYEVPAAPTDRLRRLESWTTSGRCLAIVYGDWSDHMLDSRTPGVEGCVQRGGRLVFVTEGLTRSPIVAQIEAATGQRTPHWFLTSAPPFPFLVPGALVICLDALVGVLLVLAVVQMFWRPRSEHLKFFAPLLTWRAALIGALVLVLPSICLTDAAFWDFGLSAQWRFGGPAALAIIVIVPLMALWYASRRVQLREAQDAANSAASCERSAP